jgi:hypothetical protein
MTSDESEPERPTAMRSATAARLSAEKPLDATELPRLIELRLIGSAECSRTGPRKVAAG